MGDTKQPTLKTVDPDAIGARADGLDKRVLHHILAIDRRSGHAGAIAMETRPQRGQTCLEVIHTHWRLKPPGFRM